MAATQTFGRERELGDGERAEAGGAASEAAAARVDEELDERDDDGEREASEQRDEDAAHVLYGELVGVFLAVLGARAVGRVAGPPALLELHELLRENDHTKIVIAGSSATW